jgi:hypothetical protein
VVLTLIVAFWINAFAGIVTLAVMVVVLTTKIFSRVSAGPEVLTVTAGLMKFAPTIVMSTLVPTRPPAGVTLVMMGAG